MKRKTRDEVEIEEVQEEVEEEVEHEEEEVEEEEVEIKWAKHYASCHLILLVGEGDFSFSLSLANIFGSAENMVATSLDSEEKLFKRYKNARHNLTSLRDLGAKLIHQVDAKKMSTHQDLMHLKFDRIIYNFPHAGFKGPENSTKMIKKHQDLVLKFFQNARDLLSPSGEVHVSHKDGYASWNIPELAAASNLQLFEQVAFDQNDYPGYNSKRGDGGWSDHAIRTKNSTTFKFRSLDR